MIEKKVDLKDLGNLLSQTYEGTIKGIEKCIQGYGVKLFDVILDASPVDTGYYRSNHHISVNGRDVRELGLTTDPTGVNVKLELSHRSEELNKLKTVEIGDSFYIQNDVDYAKKLEDGWSQQAPNGIYVIAENVVDFELKESLIENIISESIKL